MSDLKPTSQKITLGDKEYGLIFTINAIDDIQEHFDVDISNLGEVMKDGRHVIRNLKYILTVLINEDIDLQNDKGANLPKVDERYVGRYINTSNLTLFSTAVLKSFSNGTPTSEDDEEIPNVTSE